MSDVSHHPKDRLAELAAQLLDGALTDDDRAELFRLASENERATAQFSDLIILNAMLRKELGASRPPTLTESLFGIEESRVLPRVPRSPVVGFLGSLGRHPRSHWRSLIVASLLLSVMLHGVGLYILSIAWRGVIHDRIDTPTVATIRHTRNSVWLPGQLPTHESARLTSGVLRLQSGEAEIEFRSGAKVVLQGPIEFELHSEMRCAVQAGAAVFKVPLSAHGFTVATPTAEIVDLGTEFGVHVDSDRRMFAHCFQGRIRVEPSGPASKSVVQEILSGQSTTVAQAGIARTPASFDLRRFVRALPPVSPASDEQREPSASKVPVGVVNVDIGPPNGAGYAGLGILGRSPGLYWNVVNEIGVESPPLQTADEKLTPVTVKLHAVGMHWTDFSRSNHALIDDYTFSQHSVPGQFVIRGLLPGQTYDLYLFGSSGVAKGNPGKIDLDSPEGSLFTVGGKTKATTGLRAANGDRHFTNGKDYVTFLHVPANAHGEIAGEWVNNPLANAPDNTATTGPFNGFQLIGPIPRLSQQEAESLDGPSTDPPAANEQEEVKPAENR